MKNGKIYNKKKEKKREDCTFLNINGKKNGRKWGIPFRL